MHITTADSAAATRVARLVADLSEASCVLAAVSHDVAVYREADDRALVELGRLAEQHRQLAITHAALAAGEIARRSSPELGFSGLAQGAGFRTPAKMVQAITGATHRDATNAVKVGIMAHEAAMAGAVDAATGEVAPDSSQPWLDAVGLAVLSGQVSPSAAEGIHNGLGVPSETVTVAMLSAAAEELLSVASTTNADRVYKYARQLRDDIDEEGIALREQERKNSEFLRMHVDHNGMVCGSFRLADDNRALVTDIFDRATSPRRGGPRFVDSADAEQAERIASDPRTTEQIAADVFGQLLRLGIAADATEAGRNRLLLAAHNPSVRVLVTQKTLEAHRVARAKEVREGVCGAGGCGAGGSDAGSRVSVGHGRVEAQDQPISVASIERMVCTGTVVPVEFDDNGQALNVGREQRLFNYKQRLALAARDGGCLDPDCDRPPSWTEAHHIRFWLRDHGETNIDQGISLCRHHHRLYHANGWEVELRAGSYWLIPPVSVDPAQTPREMRSKSLGLRDLMLEQAS